MVSVEKVYGANWCGDCTRAYKFFDANNVTYEKVDLVANPSEWEQVESISGRKNIPVVVFSDKSFLVEPTDAQLAEKLGISA